MVDHLTTKDPDMDIVYTALVAALAAAIWALAAGCARLQGSRSTRS